MKQDIYEASDIQNYPIGKRIQRGDRVFHYAQAGAALLTGMGAMGKNPQDVSQQSIGAPAVVGAQSVVLTLANTDGPSYDGLLPADYLAGGYAVFFTAAPMQSFVMGIRGNTAVTTNLATATFTATLDGPLPVALTVGGNAEVVASPYRCVVSNTDVHEGTGGFCGKVGVPLIAATVNQYVWLQTWGPCFVAPHENVGKADSDMAVYFGGDGSFVQGNEDNPAAIKQGLTAQYAGFVLASAIGGGQGAPFVMLQIAP